MTDSTQNDKTKNAPAFIDANRRGFLQGAAVAGGAAATGVATSVASSEVEVEALADDKISAKGYELTDHIKKYYKRARF